MDESPAHPWIADVPVDAQQAARLIGEGIPDLRGLPVQYLGAGWDNTAFRVGDEWLARFPRKEAADALLATECATVPGLADELPLEVPAARYVVKSSVGYPWRFAVSSWLPGTAASDVELTEDERRAHIKPLAGFLRALHALPLSRPYLSRVPRGTSARDRLRTVAERARAAIHAACAEGWIEPEDGFEAILDAATSGEGSDPSDAVLCHGDLDARHVIVCDGQVTSVIDWGDIQCAGRGVDLALVPTYFEPSDWPSFRSAYGGVTDADWDVALLFALFKSALILKYAVLDGKEGFERTARATLRRLRTVGA